jgi:hypothetical protein
LYDIYGRFFKDIRGYGDWFWGWQLHAGAQ